MGKSNFILLLLALLGASLHGQDTVQLTKNFRFKDGVYFNMAQLQANRPGYQLDSLEIAAFTNPQTSLTQVDAAFFKKGKRPLQLDSVWAICMDGIPSVRVPRDEINRSLPNFAALKLRGKICYFTYPDYRKKTIRVAAYNPVTGRPFRQGDVVRDEEVIVEKMLHFQTGEVADFKVEKFLNWIQDDPLLVETINELPHQEQQEKLFKALLIYVDRNSVLMVDE